MWCGSRPQRQPETSTRTWAQRAEGGETGDKAQSVVGEIDKQVQRVVGEIGEQVQTVVAEVGVDGPSTTGLELRPEMVAAILRGLRRQLAEDGWHSSVTVGASCEEEPIEWTLGDY